MTCTYVCPDCDGRVLHLCHPPEYFRRGRLPRYPGIRRLYRIPEVEGVTLEEAFHDTYRKDTPT